MHGHPSPVIAWGMWAAPCLAAAPASASRAARPIQEPAAARSNDFPQHCSDRVKTSFTLVAMRRVTALNNSTAPIELARGEVHLACTGCHSPGVRL
jgi:hypothetical protein